MKTLLTLSCATIALCTTLSAQNLGLAATFGNEGAATFLPGPGENTMNTHHFLPGGLMLVTGTGYFGDLNNYHVSMARMDTVCGVLDTSFGTGGMIQHYHEQRTVCQATALQPDGKIVGCGMVAPSNAGSQQWPAVFRYNADGSVDSTFHGTGYHRLPFDAGAPEGNFNMVFVNADSSITCAGAGYGGKLGAYRFTTEGELDTTFNGDGHTFVNLPSFCLSGYGTGIILADGSIISAVVGNDFIDYRIELAKFTSDGEVDTTFGTNGLAMSGITATVSNQMGIAVQDDDKILISCYQGNNNFLMARFMPDGSVDLSYGVDGVSLVALDNSRGMGMQLLADGSTLQFGYHNDNGVLLKRDTNGQVVTTFGSNGFVEAYTATTLNQSFVDGELLSDGRFFGYGGTLLGDGVVIKMATDAYEYALPVISISGADLVTTGTGDMQWYLDGALINGATSNTYTPTENGDYTVEMSVSSECVFTSPVFSVLSVGMMDQANTSFRVLSNPVADVLVVLNDGAMTSYDVLGMNGKRIASGSLLSGRNTIDLSGAASGVYLLRATTDEGVQSQRIVKQ